MPAIGAATEFTENPADVVEQPLLLVTVTVQEPAKFTVCVEAVPNDVVPFSVQAKVDTVPLPAVALAVSVVVLLEHKELLPEMVTTGFALAVTCTA